MTDDQNFDNIKKKIRSENFPHNHTGIKYSGTLLLNPPRSDKKEVALLRLIPSENNFIFIKMMEKGGIIGEELAHSLKQDTRYALVGELAELGVPSAGALMDKFERAIDKTLEREFGSKER